MKLLGLEEGLSLKQIAPDVFENIEPPWTWPNTSVIPGGILMALAAQAAFNTVSPDFSLDVLQAHFVAAPKFDAPLQQRVQRISSGGRFATRVVTVEQESKIHVHVTCSFVRTSSMSGASMEHCVRRETTTEIQNITLDDLCTDGNGHRYMKFQRLGLFSMGKRCQPAGGSPESLAYLSAAHIAPQIGNDDSRLHALGILVLSDYHVLDAAPTVHGLTVGTAQMFDNLQTPTYNQFERLTSVNHTVHFHVHDGFSADKMCYIEVLCPWTNRRRGYMRSCIFNQAGKLIAACVQEAYYVLRGDKDGSKI